MGLFAKSPIKPLQRHVVCVNECCSHLVKFFEVSSKGDWEKAAEIRAQAAIRPELVNRQGNKTISIPAARRVSESNALNNYLSWTSERRRVGIWEEDVYVVDRTIDVHINRIRSKLGPYRKWIETLKGVGYRFRPKD